MKRILKIILIILSQLMFIAHVNAYNLPISTLENRYIDSTNATITLKSINWEGFNEPGMIAQGLDEQRIDIIIDLIKRSGFNSVRVLTAFEMIQSTSTVPFRRVTYNKEFLGLTHYDAFKLFIQRLTDSGLLVIIDNHATKAVPASQYNDPCEILWFCTTYTEAQWLSDWETIVDYFKNNDMVIGYELRNEPRGGENWGLGGPLDWRRASIEGIKKIRAKDPNAISFIDGINFASDIRGVANQPITSADLGGLIPRIAYSIHVYGFYQYNYGSDIHLAPKVSQFINYDNWFGFADNIGYPYTAPIWISEFGVRSEISNLPTYKSHLLNLIEYIDIDNVSFAYFSFARGYQKPDGRLVNYPCKQKFNLIYVNPSFINTYEFYCETYGLFNFRFNKVFYDWRFKAMREILF